MSIHKDSQGEPAPLVSVEEAARQLGVCRRTIYNLAASGQIRFRKIGARSMVARTEIERIVSGGAR